MRKLFYLGGIKKSCQGVAFHTCLPKCAQLITTVHLLSMCGVSGPGVVSHSPMGTFSKDMTLEVSIPADAFCREDGGAGQ